MQIIHTEKGDISVRRGFQENVDSPLVFETMDGKYVYRNTEVVPRRELERMGILPPLASTLQLDEVHLEKEYRTAGGAHRAMLKKRLAEEEYSIIPVQDSDGTESFVIRKKSDLEKAAFVSRGNAQHGSVSVDDIPELREAAMQEADNGDNEVSEV